MHSIGRHSKPGLLAVALAAAIAITSIVGNAEPNAQAQAALPTSTNAVSRDRTASISRIAANERQWNTGDAGLRVELCTGTALEIAPHSRVLRLPMVPGSLGGKDAAKSAYNVELISGRIEVDIDPSIRPIYGVIVRAPRKVAAVTKAGRATIVAAPDTVTVAARAGRDLMVGLGERWRPLRVGNALTFSTANPQGTHRKLIAAPSIAIDSPLALSMGSTFTSQHVSWNEVPDSKSYLLRVFRYGGNIPALLQEQPLVNRMVALSALPPGRYNATVSAVDSWGLESTPSSAVEFHVVQAMLPPGATVDASTIRFSSMERLRFENAEGLEVSYSRRGNDFIAAPPSIGLNHGQSVQLRLRLKGSTRETSLTLGALDLLPTVELGPTRAVWPGPPVAIAVKLQHADGQPADTTEAISASVSVNNVVVAATWQRGPGKMWCQIDQPETAGPWVVRVELRDARGHAIARNLLEVAQNVPNRKD